MRQKLFQHQFPAYIRYCLLVVTCIVGLVVLSTPTHAASSGDVIINEIMYNPSSANQNDEYVELYNTTGSNIDLGGWSFSNGITLSGGGSFAPGTMIPAGGYVVVSPSAAQTLATYGVAAVAEYAPTNLSNGGETVTLVDDTLQVINSVTYDDVAPWPTSPDGTGPSLELKGTGLDNTIPTNWGASLSSGGTPLAQNSLVGLALPTVSNVTDPNNIAASQAVDITATVTGSGISSVTLSYKLNFDPDTTLTMYDDGAHNDGAAGDDVYGAQIPGQAIKTLVRFKVTATNASGSQTSPSLDDSMDYHGYYVRDPSVTSNAPILEWFISDADYADMHANHVFDNVYLPCVIVMGDEVYDNSLVRIKGGISRTATKKSYKMKLPAGYKINIPGGSTRQTNEFHMNAEAHTGTMAHTLGAWWTVEQSGIPTPDIIPVRVLKNGEYEGLYTYSEKYESQWRQQYGYDNGQLIEDSSDIVTGPNDFTDFNTWRANMILDEQDPTKKDYILDNNDLPNMFNYMSVRTILSSWDHYAATNTFEYKSDVTGRWSLLYWDLTSAFSTDQNKSHFPSPHDHNDGRSYDQRFMDFAVYGQKDLRELYFRRLRTLADKFYSSDQLKTQLIQYDSDYSSEMALDLAKWPADGYSFRPTYAQGYEYVLREIKRHVLVLHRQPWAIPPAQTPADRAAVSLAQIVPDSTNANEFIRLYNTATTPVDLSNWVIEGINYTIPAGAVIPASGSLYLLRDDIGYRAGHAAVLVAGQYSTDLGTSGTLTLKTDTGTTIDTENY